jgi:hypothetical protein
MIVRRCEYRCVVCGRVLAIVVPSGTLIPVCHREGRLDEPPVPLTAEALG